MSKTRISIIAFHFRPDEAIGAVRPENWAIWLSNEFDVTVITRDMPGSQDDGLPYIVQRTKSRLIGCVEGLASWRRRRRILQVNVAKSHIRKQGKESGALVYRMPCLWDLWFFSALWTSLKARPDIIIATHSPYVTLLVATMHRFLRPRTKVVLDFRDLWTASHTTVGIPLIRNVEKMIERIVVKRADLVTTVSRGLADYFHALGYGHKAMVVNNSPAQTALMAIKESEFSGPQSHVLKLVYTGTIYSGHQDPTPLLRLLSAMHSRRMFAHGAVEFIVASKNPGELFALVEKEGVGDLVRFLGPLTRSESIALQQNADILVLLESGDPKVKGVLTGKVFEYLATKKPILLLGPGKGAELYDLLSSHGRLLNLEELERVIAGGSRLKECEVVDYSDISRRQLQQVMERLSAN